MCFMHSLDKPSPDMQAFTSWAIHWILSSTADDYAHAKVCKLPEECLCELTYVCPQV